MQLSVFREHCDESKNWAYSILANFDQNENGFRSHYILQRTEKAKKASTLLSLELGCDVYFLYRIC